MILGGLGFVAWIMGCLGAIGSVWSVLGYPCVCVRSPLESNRIAPLSLCRYRAAEMWR